MVTQKLRPRPYRPSKKGPSHTRAKKLKPLGQQLAEAAARVPDEAGQGSPEDSAKRFDEYLEDQPRTLYELATKVRASVPEDEWRRLPKDFASKLDEMPETAEGGR